MARVLTNTTPELRRAWHAVACSDEIGTGPHRVLLLGEAWVLARLDGVLVAARDRCPHRGAPLSAGCVTGGDGGMQELQCGYHGWRFGATGACTAIPALGPDATLPPRARLETPFAVAESAGLVWITPEEPVGPLPVMHEHGDPAFMSGFARSVRTTVSAAQLIDNFMDAAHFPFVHGATFGVDGAAITRDDGIERLADRVASRFSAPYREDGRTLEHTVEKIGHAGFVADLTLRFPETGGVFRILYACQPESATSTRVHKLMARNDIGHDPARWQRLVDEEDQILAEDLAILERYDDMCVHLDDNVEIHTRADRLSLSWRRLMAEHFGG